MFEYELNTTTLVHMATLAYVLGFVLTNQFALRILILMGSGFYILYYYNHLDTPQWDAIAGSMLIVTATIIGMIALICSRITFGMNNEQRQLLGLFGALEPGECRKLVRAGRMVTATEPVCLTEQGAEPSRLYFVVSGAPLIEKSGVTFRISPGTFIGEVGFLLEIPASATVMLPDGGRYYEWERDALTRVLDRNPGLRSTFDTMLGRDMASKLAESSRDGSSPTMAMQAA